MGERKPITQQRSEWVERDLTAIAGVPAQQHARRVGDGLLVVIVAEEPMGWHLSISFRDHKGNPSRYPRWDEIADARDEFLSPDLEFAMFLPRSEEYVAHHDTTFHLHEYPRREP